MFRRLSLRRLLRRPLRGLFLLWRFFTFPFRALGRGVRWLLRGCAALWETERLRHLVYGLPAFVVGVGTCILVLGAQQQASTLRAERYLEAARSAMEAGQLQKSRMFFERALELSPRDYDAMFDLAQVAEKLGDATRIGPIMQQLAPPDRAVHAKAHVWRAAMYRQLPPTPENQQLIEQQLRFALQLEPDLETANFLLGEMFFRKGALTGSPVRPLLEEAAARLLKSGADLRNVPEASLLLARTYTMLGDSGRARRYGGYALDAYAARSRQNPEDVDALYNWADAAMFLEQYPEAASLLTKSLEFRDEPRIRRGLARLYIAWADSLAQAGGSPHEQFRLVATALITDPDELQSFERMIKLLRPEGELQKSGREQLQQYIAVGQSVPICHLILGVLDFEGGSPEEAKFHMERAYDELPTAPIIVNNLAWFITFSPDGDLEEALRMMNEVVERFPEDGRFRDTRGVLLTKLKRHREAIRDLELALPTHAQFVETHQALAESYRELGLVDMAARHQRLAEKLAQQPVAPGS